MQNDVTPADLIAAVLKLAANIERLETAVMKLGARMRKPDNETFAPCDWYSEIQRMLVQRMPRDVAGAFAAIGSIDERVAKLDLHLNAIRAHVKDINEDANQRATFREWSERP